jgi:hypothetical protein
MGRPLPVSDMWTVSVSNEKTGVIPTQYIGLTQDETLQSCRGCPLSPKESGGCYAWSGRACRGANSVRKATRRGRPARLIDAIARAPRAARIVRFGAIGDPARVHRHKLLADVETARAHDLGVVGYTHFWKDEPSTGVLRRIFLASCETLESVERAQKLGWLVSLAGPVSAPGMVTCPNYRRPEIQCNRCGLCDVETLRRTNFSGVVFPAHGIGAKRLPLAGLTL